jgi:hypothetical protein
MRVVKLAQIIRLLHLGGYEIRNFQTPSKCSTEFSNSTVFGQALTRYRRARKGWTLSLETFHELDCFVLPAAGEANGQTPAVG